MSTFIRRHTHTLETHSHAQTPTKTQKYTPIKTSTLPNFGVVFFNARNGKIFKDAMIIKRRMVFLLASKVYARFIKQVWFRFGGLHSAEVAFLLLKQRPWVPFLAFLIIYFNFAEVNQWRWLEESGQRLENIDWTHLVLSCGKLALQK